jgi:hypothetical protein
MNAVNIDESQLVVSSNFAISNMMSICFELTTGRTRYSMSHYKKNEIVGHIQKYKVCKRKF